MPHCNNPQAKARKANRHGPKPKFLVRAKKSKGNAAAPLLDADGNPLLPSEDVDATAAAEESSPAPIASEGTRAEKTALITEWHALEKQLASPALKDPIERKKILARQKELGGLAAYQAASVHGGDKVRGGETGKWCVTQLKELKVGVDKGKGKAKVEPIILADGTKQWPKVEREKLRLLDVGAIGGTSYADWSWIDTTSIDLNPGAPHVLKYDFFDYPVPEKPFDVVALSLVINFEGSLTRRGEMLRHAHKYLKPTGMLYIVLPLPCLVNSRYCTHDRFESILKSTGWKTVRQHDSAKLTYFLCARIGDGRGDELVWKREEVRSGVHRNNFCIVVGGGAAGGETKEEGEKMAEEKKAEGEMEEEEEEEAWGGIKEDGEAEAGDDGEEWGGIEVDEPEWGGIAE